MGTATRQRWMGLLARANPSDLETAWNAMQSRPDYVFLRRPETGLVMVRGRTGGTGDAFNLGEMTVTRCAVRLTGGGSASGFSYVAGRHLRHAELAALFDAMLQEPVHRLEAEQLLGEIEGRWLRSRAAKAAEVAATRVDFVTLVREQADAG